jgi:tellurite resistance protein
MSALNQVRTAVSSPAARAKWLARGAWLLAIAEGLVAVRNHLADRLSEKERRRLVEIVKSSKGLPTKLDDKERRELQALIAKIEPKELAKTVASSSLVGRARRRR